MNELVDKQTARAMAPWVHRLARYGYAAKGAVYIVVGGLALQAALGSGGETTDTEGALRAIFRQPFGALLLLIVGVGLFSYTAWRVTQSIFDVEGKGSGFHGLLKRFGYLVSGIAYGGLGVSALRQVIGLAATGGRSQEDWTQLVLAHPFGRWLVIAAGLVLAALAINAAVVALGRMYRRKLMRDEMSDAAWNWAASLAVIGMLARGMVFGLLAVFFIQAGWDRNANQAGGLSDVLVAIAAQPQGPWLLGTMAAGLVAYGLYAEVEARYRRIPLDSRRGSK
ncbi:MAG: DUF1206 domain-containing protein [Trueperaceae bacterium]